jgi:hypothetical protein
MKANPEFACGTLQTGTPRSALPLPENSVSPSRLIQLPRKRTTHVPRTWTTAGPVRILGDDRETQSLRVNMKLKRLTGERPSTVLAWRRVAEGNCVAVRRGGEQPEANLSSQSSQTRRLNPIRPVGVASLRRRGEALALSLPEAITKHDHTIAKDSEGGWDEKAGKADQLSVEILPGATESGEEVRALIVALKRVTTVEPRGAGR